jgi:hypothetical protein
MTRSPAVAQLSSAFNDFLFAPITDDQHGMPLSVLSALARLNFDPWQEAAGLALLPREAAIQRLTGLIAALPGGTPAHPGPTANAAGLIGLLPHQTDTIVTAREGLFDAGAKPNLLALAYLVVLAFMLGSQLFVASREQSAHAHSRHAPSTVMTSALATPPMATPSPDASR